LSDIIKFMSNKKIFANAQNLNKDKKKHFSTKDHYDKKRRTNGKHKFGNHKCIKEAHGETKPDSECPIHQGHLWIKCYNNPNGDTYKPRDGNRPPNGGRGQGQGGYSNSGHGNGGHGNGHGRGTGQYSFQAAAKLPAALEVAPIAEAREQHHFDQIDKDPEWGWDAKASQSGD
jgi:hypothetical protein